MHSKFVNLIRKFLKAGYMEDWKYHATYKTPQGDILSPILSNIYLNELDLKIIELKKEFDMYIVSLLSIFNQRNDKGFKHYARTPYNPSSYTVYDKRKT